MYRMQPSASEEAPVTGSGDGAQPTREQEEYARGFVMALDRIYAQRGTPVAVRDRTPSTSRPAADAVCVAAAAAPSSPPSAAVRSGQSSSSSSSSTSSAVRTALLISDGSRSAPVAVTDLMVSAEPEAAAATDAAIPLCVTRLAASDESFDQQQLSDISDEEQQQQPNSSRLSTGMPMTRHSSDVLPTQRYAMLARVLAMATLLHADIGKRLHG